MYGLELPIDETANLNEASYKNPSRLLVRTKGDRTGWVLWFGVNGKAWPLGQLKKGKGTSPVAQKTALVFRLTTRSKGVNPDLAAASGGLVTAAEIRAADKFAVWIVSPDGSQRSLAWWCQNDQYIDKLTPGGTPKKTRRSLFPKQGVDLPPGFSGGPVDPPPPPPVDPPPGVYVAPNDVELAELFRRASAAQLI